MAFTDLPTRWPTRKVVAGAGGAGAGTVVSDFIVWAISAGFLDGKPLAQPPQTLIQFVTPVALAMLLAYFTPRGAEEVAPPQRRGQHVRPHGEAGSSCLGDAIVVAAVLVIIVTGLLSVLGGVRP